MNHESTNPRAHAMCLRLAAAVAVLGAAGYLLGAAALGAVWIPCAAAAGAPAGQLAAALGAATARAASGAGLIIVLRARC